MVNDSIYPSSFIKIVEAALYVATGPDPDSEEGAVKYEQVRPGDVLRLFPKPEMHEPPQLPEDRFMTFVRVQSRQGVVGSEMEIVCTGKDPLTPNTSETLFMFMFDPKYWGAELC